MSDLEKYKIKYKKELDLLDKYINNAHIYDVIIRYESDVDGKKIRLGSNINVFEMVFLGKLIEQYKCNNILEIGCANGVSGMVIVNQLCINGGGKLISIDPFQTSQWYNAGKSNIKKIIDMFNTKKIVSEHMIIENYSSPELKNFIQTSKFFDCVFIDGSHGFLDVVIDIFCGIKILKKNGILVLDDVLHEGVKLVVDELVHYKNLKKIHLKEDSDGILSVVDSNYIYKTYEKSHLNPRTMYAYVKI
jgi:predicted O-methyltransferase YrrM